MIKKRSLFSILLTAITLLIFCCSGNNALPTPSEENPNLDFIVDFQNNVKTNGITNYGIWKVNDKSEDDLFYVIKEDAGRSSESGGELLCIFDKHNHKLFEDSATSFDGIEIFHILRKQTPQMIIKSINYGGSGRFFKILDYNEGKVITLTNEDDTMYSGDVTILSQYQEEKYYTLPYQVFLTEDLVSNDAPATVLQYVNGKYTAVGKINQKSIGELVEHNTK